jgi:hypothetical protein
MVPRAMAAILQPWGEKYQVKTNTKRAGELTEDEVEYMITIIYWKGWRKMEERACVPDLIFE